MAMRRAAAVCYRAALGEDRSPADFALAKLKLLAPSAARYSEKSMLESLYWSPVSHENTGSRGGTILH
jgi:hypothetical protein